MSARDAGSGSGRDEKPAPSRRSSFLATRQDEALEAETLRIKAEVVDAFPDDIPDEKKDDDIPVLTDAVPADGEERETEDAGEAPPDSPTSPEVDLEEFAKQMAEAIEQQLAYELPTLVEASLLNISGELCSGIVSTMKAALKDFVARSKQQ
jgi:hypothetical protein